MRLHQLVNAIKTRFFNFISTLGVYTTLAFFLLSALNIQYSGYLDVRAQYGCDGYGENSLGYGNDCDIPITDTDNSFDSFSCSPGDSVANVALIQKPATCTGTLSDGYTNPAPDAFQVGVDSGNMATCTFDTNNKDFTCANVNVGTSIGSIPVIGQVGSGSTFNIQISSTDYEIEVNEAISFYTDSNGTNPFPGDPGELSLTEGSGSESYYFVLNRQPTNTIAFTINTDTQVRLTNGNSVNRTFTNSNWDTVQVANVFAEDDMLAESSPHTGFVSHTSITSTDSLFSGITIPFQIQGNITDNDSADISLGGVGNALTMPENNATQVVPVELTSSPAVGEQVVIDVVSGDTDEATVSPAQLTFDDTNWSTPQDVTIASVNDDYDRDDSVNVSLTVDDANSDDNFDGVSQTIVVTLTDDDTAGFQFDFDHTVDDVDVTEGASASYTVRLTSRPTNSTPLQLQIQPNDPSPDTDFFWVNTETAQTNAGTVTFDDTDWDSPKTITINAQEDADADNESGTTTHTIPSFAGIASEYASLAQSEVVNINVFDNDTAGITITPQTGGSIDVDEGNLATVDTYVIATTTTPGADVTVTVDPNFQSEVDLGSGYLGANNSGTIDLTAANGYQVTVTVRANDDVLVESNPHQGFIAHSSSSSDANYHTGLSIPSASVNVTENDTADFSVTQISPDPAENGGTVDYEVELTSRPQNDVYIFVQPFNAGRLTTPTPKTVSIAGSDYDYHFKFTTISGDPVDTVTSTSGWNVPQTITYTAVNNDVDRNYTATMSYRIIDAISNDLFDGIPNKNIITTITDDDSSALNIYEPSTTTPVTSLSAEEGVVTNESFDVVLNSEPVNNVTVTLSAPQIDIEGLGEGNNLQLTFTPGNWDTPQNVTIEADDDFIDEGAHNTNISYSISSADTIYNNLTPAQTPVSITDNDTAEILLNPVSTVGTPLVIAEGGTNTFQVRLNSEPTSAVTLNVVSNNTSEASVSSNSLTFNPSNWANNQTITLTNTEDDFDIENQTAQITVSINAGVSNEYNGVSSETIFVQITDNDTAGVIIQNIGGSNTQVTEAGGTDTYSIELDSSPEDDVVITLAPHSELGTNTNSVTFTSGSAPNSPQIITVNAVDDDIDNDNRTRTITHSAASTGDANYDGSISISNTDVVIVDNDTAGVNVIGSGLTTTEAGGTATVQFELDSEPTGPVTIALSSNDTSEGTLLASSITIAAADWDNPSANEIVVTGQDDVLQDGNITYQLVTGNVTSSDPKYDAFVGSNVSNVNITNQDDDTAGITVTKSGTDISEDGTLSVSFDINLSSDPSGTVSLPISVSDASEASFSNTSSVSSDTLTLNFGVTSTVTVYGVDEDIDDGDVSVDFVTGDPTSSNGVYDALDASDVADFSFDNIDDDTAGIVVSTNSVTMNEDSTTTVTVELESEPTSDVELDLTSGGEVIVSPATLTFTSGNWDSPQTLTLTNANDNDLGNDTDTITVAVDTANSAGEYASVADTNIPVNVTDNDSAGIQVAKTGTDTSEDGLQTVTFDFSLASDPGETVKVPVTLSDATEVSFSNTSSVTSDSLVITYGSTTSITVYGVDEDIDDGDVSVNFVTGDPTSNDGTFDALGAGDVQDFTFDNIDDDTAGGVLPPTGGTVNGNNVSIPEGSNNQTLPFRLNSEPTANVVFDLTTNGEVTTNPTTLTFTPANWDDDQLITLINAEDTDLGDDSDVLTIAVDDANSATEYQGQADVTVNITVVDNDAATITITQTGTNTSENGSQTIDFEFNLTSNAGESVDVPLTLDDASEVSFSNSASDVSETITINFGTPTVVTVYGVDDALDDGDVSVNLVTGDPTSNNAAYDALGAGDVDDFTFDNIDDEAAGIGLSVSAITMDEGDTSSFTVELDAEPTSDVVLDISSGGEVGVSPTTITFTPANWDQPQTVTLTSTNDNDLGDDTDTITIAVDDANSAPEYGTVPDSTFTVTVTDDDSAGVIFTETGGTTEVTEGGATDIYSIMLTAIPDNDVTIDLTTGGGVTVNPTSVTFTSGAGSNWNTPQDITITAVDDTIVETGETDVVSHSITTTDPNYSSVTPGQVNITITDNDSAGIDLTNNGVGGGSMTLAEGSSDTIEVVLDSQPTGNVVLTIVTDDVNEAAVSPTTLTFTPVNWNTSQSVTVTNTDDNTVGSDSAQVTIAVDNSQSSPDYANISSTFDITIIDNDTVNIVLTTITAQSSEDGTATAEVQATLTSEPTDDVVLDLSVDDTTEGSVQGSITILAANWNDGTSNRIYVDGVNDNEVDGDILYNLNVDGVTSNDTTYDSFDTSTITATALENLDDDTGIPTVNITFTGSSLVLGETSEDGSDAVAQFELSAEPINNESVTITFESSDTTEGSLPQSSLTIDSSNWDNPTLNQLTIEGVDDFVDDGDIDYVLSTLDVTSNDAGYDVVSGGNVADANLTNVDNDTRGVLLTPGQIILTEGESGEFEIVLESEPTEDVRLDLTYDEDRVKITPKVNNIVATALSFVPLRTLEQTDSYTFTSTNWDEPKVFTITALDNSEYLGANINELVVTNLVTNGDYQGIALTDFTVIIQDNDQESTINTGGTGQLVTATLLFIGLIVGVYGAYSVLKKKN